MTQNFLFFLTIFFSKNKEYNDGIFLLKKKEITTMQNFAPRKKTHYSLQFSTFGNVIMNNTTFVYQNPNVTEYSSLMVSIRWELRACGGYSLGKSTLPPTTIEYTNFRLTCRPTLLPPPPPPRLKPHLLLSQQEWGGVGSIDYYEHREAKLCLFVPHGYSTLTFK